jgi:hypothetical protein
LAGGVPGRPSDARERGGGGAGGGGGPDDGLRGAQGRPGVRGQVGRALGEGRARIGRGETPAIGRDEIVRSSRHGRPCVMRVGPGRWSAGKEALFLAVLEEGANVKRAAEAAGLSTTALYRGGGDGSRPSRRPGARRCGAVIWMSRRC